MTPASHARRSKRKAAGIFVLLFCAVLVGGYLTGGADVVGLGGRWSLVALLAVLVSIAVLFFVT
jgi:hypothetical protein